jgi:hypothetical protein
MLAVPNAVPHKHWSKLEYRRCALSVAPQVIAIGLSVDVAVTFMPIVLFQP